MFYRMKVLAVVVGCLIAVPMTVAANDEGRGLEIARKVDKRDAGYGDISVRGVLINRSASGSVNRRVFEMITVETQGSVNRRLVKVDAPASLRGTVFLTHPHIDEPDDTWMRLASENRIRRIASSDKSGRFLSSQFSLEDITPWALERYRYRYLGEADCAQSECFRIENRPLYDTSAYSRQLELLDKEIYQPRAITYWDHSGKEVKRLEFSEYERLIGDVWRPHRMVMTNLVTGDSSEIVWEEYRVGRGLGPEALTPRNLSRLAP